ncbi:MAG: FliM/FliN family flagellar motor switch protein [Hyphomonadaceae bacterium]
MTQPANPALAKSLMDVPVQVDIVLGEARMPIEELMALSPGEVLALESRTKDDVLIYVSNRLMARGRLVIADGELGVTLSEIIDERVAA